MVDNMVTKLLGLVLIAAAHTVSDGQKVVTGILGSNVTLPFQFHGSEIRYDSHFAIYRNEKKIAECKNCSRRDHLDIVPENSSVLFHITNLTLNDSTTYLVSLFLGSQIPTESNKVYLIVQEDNRSSTVPPVSTGGGSSTIFPSHIVIVLVVLPVVLLAAVLPWFIWCLVRTKDEEQHPLKNSNPTAQEIVEESNTVPQPSVVYSILDFPKRPPAVLEMNPNDTEYAAVSYLPDSKSG